MKKLFLNKYFKYLMFIAAGLLLGWLLFHDSERSSSGKSGKTVANDHAEGGNDADQHTVWTCSMHPHIRMDKPGDCPICGMDLIPLSQAKNVSVDPDAVHLSKEAAQLANVTTSVVGSRQPVKEVRLYGRVQVDERLLQSQVAHVPGRIEKLNVNFTGESVKQGQLLAEIYSPELIAAQQELLQTLRTKQQQPGIYEASKDRLKQWKLTENQIEEIEKSGKIVNAMKVYSNTSGTVVTRNVNTGDYVNQGAVLYSIADLSKVWVLFDAYESDLPFLAPGKKLSFTLQALPGKKFSGIISFIDPVIDPAARVARVRVEAGNKSGDLKPEMFATGIVSADLPESGNSLVIPSSAILWTGKRSIVYVKQPGNEMIFKLREIELGPSLGDSFVVKSGLDEGEVIVTNGTFSVDASAQLEGKPSMMNPDAGSSTSGHDHSIMSSPGGTTESLKSSESGKNVNVSNEFKLHMNKIYDNYIILKNALVNSDPATAKKAASSLQNSLSGTDMGLLNGNAHDIWMDASGKMSKATTLITGSSDIEEQRAHFSELGNNLYVALQSFGLVKKIVHRQFCPMAFENKGAYWLSESEEIRNPYFGEVMMTCGETREYLRF